MCAPVEAIVVEKTGSEIDPPGECCPKTILTVSYTVLLFAVAGGGVAVAAAVVAVVAVSLLPSSASARTQATANNSYE